MVTFIFVGVFMDRARREEMGVEEGFEPWGSDKLLLLVADEEHGADHDEKQDQKSWFLAIEMAMEIGRAHV